MALLNGSCAALQPRSCLGLPNPMSGFSLVTVFCLNGGALVMALHLSLYLLVLVSTDSCGTAQRVLHSC